MTDGVASWEAMQERLAAPVEAAWRPHVSWRWYIDGVEQEVPDLPSAIEEARAGRGFIWCGMRDPDDDTMATFQQLFGLHDLAVEDTVEGHTRSKLESFGDTLFLVISTVDYVEHTSIADAAEIVSTGQIMVFVSPWFVMTSRWRGRALMNQIRQQLEADPDELALGPWRVLYRILDHVLDDFSDTLREMEADLDEIEDLVFGTEPKEIERPYQLKRELIEFKRCVQPLGAPLLALQTKPFAAIPEEARAYFREVADHHLGVRDGIASIDEVLGTILQAALARASVADNRDMRKISAWLALFAVPTTLGSIYGMNFDNIPELHVPNGYFLTLGIMAVLMLVLLVVFRRAKWL